jgi:hypothetical protein
VDSTIIIDQPKTPRISIEFNDLDTLMFLAMLSEYDSNHGISGPASQLGPAINLESVMNRIKTELVERITMEQTDHGRVLIQGCLQFISAFVKCITQARENAEKINHLRDKQARISESQFRGNAW